MSSTALATGVSEKPVASAIPLSFPTLILRFDKTLSDRTTVALHFGDEFIKPTSPKLKVRPGKCDFQCRDEKVQFKTPNGRLVISYAKGYPVGRFEPSGSPGQKNVKGRRVKNGWFYGVSHVPHGLM